MSNPYSPFNLRKKKKESLWDDENEKDPWAEDDPWKEDEEPAWRESRVHYPIGADKTISKVFIFVFGLLCAGLGIPGAIITAVMGKTSLLSGALLPIFGIAAAVGIALILLFFIQMRFVSRFYRYVHVIDERIDLPISELAASENATVEETTRQLDRMIDKEYFPEGRIDRQEQHLYLTREGFLNRKV